LLIGLLSVSLGASQNNSWDYLLLVQLWPGTVCSDSQCDEPTTANYFTLHGLWPNRDDGTWPSYCGGSTFNPNSISDLIPTMDTVWTDLWEPSDDLTFWGHEWEKHGTCAASLASLSTQHDYFAFGLQLYQSTNLVSVLSSAGITQSPSATYPSSSFISAVESGLGVTPWINCYNDDAGQQLLDSIMLCASKSLALMDCPAPTKTSCSGSIGFPPPSGSIEKQPVVISLV